MNTRRTLAALVGSGALTFALFGAASTALATAPDVHKVTICHATNSNSHPYVQEAVDISSSGNHVGELKGGHNHHDGPIWDPSLKDQKTQWGDIIPSYTYDPTGFQYAGKNWTEGGPNPIYDNGCKVPGEAVEPFVFTEVHLGAADDGDAVVVDNANPASEGDAVHDSARIEFPLEGNVPDGSSVTFSFWANGQCSGDVSHQSSAQTLTGVSPILVDPGLVEGPLDPGAYSFRASFTSGDPENLESVVGDCEPFVVLAANVAGETTVPSEPNTATIGPAGTSGPSNGAWLLVAALGVVLASVVVMTPVRVRNR